MNLTILAYIIQWAWTCTVDVAYGMASVSMDCVSICLSRLNITGMCTEVTHGSTALSSVVRSRLVQKFQTLNYLSLHPECSNIQRLVSFRLYYYNYCREGLLSHWRAYNVHKINGKILDVTKNSYVDALYGHYFQDPMKNKGYHDPPRWFWPLRSASKCFKQNRESSASVAPASSRIVPLNGEDKRSGKLLVYIFN